MSEAKPQGGGCRYTCKDPEGKVYCCRFGDDEIITPTGPKPGSCPPVRQKCPERGFFDPSVCSHDSICPGSQKCCYDRCLEHHTCKPPQ
ncbi:hypothetical protein Pmani_014050 [Petrolisthes manimaculis]|nr:hypothetical protein Pmani_014050 [Petrolisthes manimaculis]